MTDRRSLRPARSLGSRRVLLALALLALLGVVAIAARGRAPAGGRAERAPSAIFNDLATVALMLGILMCLALVYLLLTNRQPQRKASTGRQLLQLASLVAVAFLLAILLGGRRVDLSNPFDAATLPPTTTAEPRPAERRARPSAGRPELRWLPAAVIGVLLLAGGVVWVAVDRRRKAAAEDPSATADALAAVLDEALADLRAEADARRAVIAAYARMEKLLAAHGIRRRVSETPFEYLGRVLTGLDVAPGAVFDLTELFERAKFSRHAIGADLKEEAITALQAVRDDLAPAAVAA